MSHDLLDAITRAIETLDPVAPLGKVREARGGLIRATGLSDRARLGDQVLISGTLEGEIVLLDADTVSILPDGPPDGAGIGDSVVLSQGPTIAPHPSWLGRVIDPNGKPLDGRPLLRGDAALALRAAPPPAHTRRSIGARLATPFAALNTFLPLARGQRVGLFAGSGVGKSTLVGKLARGIEADVAIVALAGERGREVRDFIDNTLGSDGMARSIVVAATSDRSAQVRRRCAWTATTLAEYFRDQGLQVLLVVDSVTRYAEAHREMAAACGEPATLRGFPATTASQIAALCERAGPGAGEAGDITAVYTVLVAGSDMEEPVADWLRGTLDGHIVLSRDVAEQGRFPAIDLLRSVSRALPGVATLAENTLLEAGRRSLGVYAKSEMMIQSGLYQSGSDPSIDVAIALQPALETFLTRSREREISHSFEELRRIIGSSPSGRSGQ